jgi:outer membrane biosynthesis protein TonB
VRTPRISSHRSGYRERFLIALAVVLGGILVLVNLWPNFSHRPEADGPFRDRAPETIQMEEVQPTRQVQDLRPPPPAPLPPVVVPNDRIIETDFELSDGPLALEAPGPDARRQEGQSGLPTAARTPDTSARLLRAVQPTYPDRARKDGVRARVKVSVQVDDRGRVTEATVVGRWRLDEGGRASPVASLGYGLDDAALAAAHRSRFRPAKHQGQPVPTRTTITFTFGN